MGLRDRPKLQVPDGVNGEARTRRQPRVWGVELATQRERMLKCETKWVSYHNQSVISGLRKAR